MIIKNRKINCYFAVIFMMVILLTSCSTRIIDEEPPTAPLLTVLKVEQSTVNLAWSESYDNEGIDIYKLYRDGDLLKELSNTEYTDNEVSTGKDYEYYVVAYDEAGNRSSKSVKQRVTVPDVEIETTNINQNSNNENITNSNISIQKLSKSTVKLYTLDDDLNVIAMGSGTIVDNNGYILTNYHCVGDENGLYNNEGYVAIAITENVKKNIQPQYIAKVKSGVKNLDLAVVQIISDLNWNKVSGSDLNLVPAKITDSDKVQLGDDINILGYPGVGGETITFTAGRVSGFLDDDNDSDVDWIKTDAVVNHGNSGGTAINGNGEMIGVPTAKQVGEDNDIMFYLRPVNKALSIIKDAMLQGDNPDFSSFEPQNPYDENYDYIIVSGRIIDAYTQQPIFGAAFAVLSQGVTIDEFTNDPQDSMLIAYGETDSDGVFILEGVPKGCSYSVIVGADGYNVILEDNALEIPADWDGEMDLGDIYLELAQ